MPKPGDDLLTLDVLIRIGARYNRGAGVRVGLHNNDINTYECEAVVFPDEGIKGFGDTPEEAVLHCLELVMDTETR